jgi:hypothetical protein
MELLSETSVVPFRNFSYPHLKESDGVCWALVKGQFYLVSHFETFESEIGMPLYTIPWLLSVFDAQSYDKFFMPISNDRKVVARCFGPTQMDYGVGILMWYASKRGLLSLQHWLKDALEFSVNNDTGQLPVVERFTSSSINERWNMFFKEL